MRQFYGAYGSNLNVEQMGWRCPTAKLYGAGVIKGYRLTFQGETGYSYANVVPCPGSQVSVLVWEIDGEAERRLDRYEGYPKLYTKAPISVTLESGDSVDVMAYVMTAMRPQLGVPSEQYYRCVEEGYLEAGFSLEPIEQALSESLWPEDCLGEAGGQNG